MFRALSEFADNIDFDTDGSSIADEIAFSFTAPLKINIDSVMIYFGEKIALYFLFLRVYTKSMFWMVIIGIVS